MQRKLLFLFIACLPFSTFAQDIITANPLWLPSSHNPALAGSTFSKNNVGLRYASRKEGMEYVSAGGSLGIYRKSSMRNGFGVGALFQQVRTPIKNGDQEVTSLNAQTFTVPLSMSYRDRDKTFSFGLSLGVLMYSFGESPGVYYSQLDPNSDFIGSTPSYALSKRQEGSVDIGGGISYYTHENLFLSFSAKHLQSIIQTNSDEVSLFQDLSPRFELMGRYIFFNPINYTGVETTFGYFNQGENNELYVSAEARLSVIKIGGGWIPSINNFENSSTVFITSSVKIPFGDKANYSKIGRINKESDHIELRVSYYPEISSTAFLQPALEFTLSAGFSNDKYKEQMKRLSTLPVL
ncbi:PorP/SprF family type IX secretion system membrane protein [Flammeovirga aprica]|uniref:Type IX secretion system membrane protein PorP/SprF n=1 Tax=Flammeovirga aprica JL-4 TaxID=694437 RepID=A0A7X9XA62_9BACT|nr:hypothetical protein [Flammeovirga aprica]NME69355.1 hypothetical protein [Flammeovirga aprica JL-4]